MQGHRVGMHYTRAHAYLLRLIDGLSKYRCVQYASMHASWHGAIDRQAEQSRCATSDDCDYRNFDLVHRLVGFEDAHSLHSSSFCIPPASASACRQTATTSPAKVRPQHGQQDLQYLQGSACMQCHCTHRSHHRRTPVSPRVTRASQHLENRRSNLPSGQTHSDQGAEAVHKR